MDARKQIRSKSRYYCTVDDELVARVIERKKWLFNTQADGTFTPVDKGRAAQWKP